MNKTDVIIAFVILVVAFGLGATQLIPKKEATNAYVSVQIDGKEVKKIPMDDAHKGKAYIFHAHGGTNKLIIDEKGARMTESDCPDGICMKMAPIKRQGEMIVCLPHRIIAEIKSDETPTMDLLLR